MLYATHLVFMLHPEPAWIDPIGVLKYTSSTYAIIFFCQIYETAGFKDEIEGKKTSLLAQMYDRIRILVMLQIMWLNIS